MLPATQHNTQFLYKLNPLSESSILHLNPGLGHCILGSLGKTLIKLLTCLGYEEFNGGGKVVMDVVSHPQG